MNRGFSQLLSVLGILWLLFATCLWLTGGWRVMAMDPPPALLGGFPWRGILALILGIIAAGALTLLGVGCTRHLRGPGWLPRLAFGFLAGTATMGLIGGFVAFVFVGPWLIPGALAGAAVLWRRGWHTMPRESSTVGALGVWGAVPLLLLFIPILLAAMAPAVESDGLRYHLPVAAAWLREGRFCPLPFNANSNLPAMQSLIAALTAGMIETGRVYQVLNAFHGLALAVVCGAIGKAVMRSLVARRGIVYTGLPDWTEGLCTMFVYAVPSVAIIAAWPFSDVAATAHLMAGIWVALPGTVRGRAPRMALASLFLGAAVAIKISMLPLAGMVGLVLLGDVLLQRRQLVRSMALLVIPGALVLAPWLVKSFAYHGNPVYPLAWGVFGGPEWSTENDAFYKAKSKEKGMGHNVQALVATPLNITVNWPQFESFNPGPAPLALLPLALLGGLWGLGRRVTWRLWLLGFIGAGWLVWFASYQSVRFLMPQILAVTVLGVPMLLWLGAMSGILWVRAAGFVLLAVALAGSLWAPVYHLRTAHTYRIALGITGDELAIAGRFNSWPAVEWLNANAEPGEKVVYIGEFRPAGAHVYTPVSSDWFDTPLVLVEIRATKDNGEILERWRSAGVRHVLLNQAELSLYEEAYFRPRFRDGEWARFESLRRDLLENIVEQPAPGVFILAVPPRAAGQDT